MIEPIAAAFETVKWFLFAMFVAWLIEASVEFLIGLLFDYFPQTWQKYKRLIAVVAAVVFSLLTAYHYQIDLVAAAMNAFDIPHPIDGHGIAMSGVAIGMGAEFVHKLFKRVTEPEKS